MNNSCTCTWPFEVTLRAMAPCPRRIACSSAGPAPSWMKNSRPCSTIWRLSCTSQAASATPHSTVTAQFHQFRREMRVAQERAEAAIRLAKEQGFPYWMAYGSIMWGWALAHQGQVKEGIEQMTQGLRAYRA